MAQSAPLFIRMVASSIAAANKAGQIVRDVMKKGDLGIIDKGKNDLQTEGDRSAQRCIIASLSHQFPGVTIIGEEEDTSSCPVPADWVVTTSDEEVLGIECPKEYQDATVKDIVVWVDPLDGTAEYTQGFLDHVTILIGIAVRNRAVGGVIHQPFYSSGTQSGTDSGTLGRTLWGIVGAGVGGFQPAYVEGDRRVITTTRSHLTPTVQAAVDAMKPDEVLKVGGAGHKVMLLLEGKANAYMYPTKGTKRWDTCAPEAVLHAMGGKLTDMYGNYYSYAGDTNVANLDGVLATAKAQDHHFYLKVISDVVKPAS
ncbi:3'(2'),5'-bisphosphate nucleotidase 1 isoform X2 [Nilaparvata lugens]|uniref:3'(2'),5'-bisphosphate nucleotidase 1 isoform X2 n=1 Tax=Nilaparvata lugens TaxID=108931 RepID=UPI00193CBE57|nr:3'(2'),5'-bisphosphate nucleotidase 1 isoform X2 [Nilaparvata lugens]